MIGPKAHIKLFDDYINNFIDDLNDNSVYKPIKYFLKLPSKKVRPLLTLIASGLYNKDLKYALPASLANEVFHNFTLIHDDIMDSSKIRRGNETVHVKWNLNQAILSGDAMQILAYKSLEHYESDIQKKLIKIFNDTALKVCEGQQLDVEFENQIRIKFSDYLMMIKYKTAVLLGSSLKMGGIINKASESDLELLYDIGINLGLAFQIQDDYLDLFGDKNLIGKKIGGDIIKRKKTVLYHIFKESSTPQNSKIIDEIYETEDIEDDVKIEKIMTLYQDNEVNTKTKFLSEEYSTKAITSIKSLSIQNEETDNLLLICNNLILRNF
jgi:geranylgeranyl diphosphate synthase type II